MYSGIVDLSWWGYIVVALVLTHLTIASVTIYLHRHSAHRALDLHPLISHFFRAWLWLTTGIVTKQWTAIHRKHHARCETEQDPHSPQVFGLYKVVWSGAELYKKECHNSDTMSRFGKGTPDDWIERRVYTPHSMLGIAAMLIINVALFGFLGLTIWAVQMMWIPLFAAGVINGVGHYWGYRNFQAEDASHNIVPWGVLIGGEELHNNHHAYPSSAKLSSKWWELDIGWVYIRLLEFMGLARVKKVAPTLKLVTAKTRCDRNTVEAVIHTRFDVLASYSRALKNTCRSEIKSLREAVRLDRTVATRWLRNQEHTLSLAQRDILATAINKSRTLHTVHSMRKELCALWQRSSLTGEELVHHLEAWCQRAEASGLAALREFSLYLRRYELSSI